MQSYQGKRAAHAVQVHGTELVLLPERAVFVPGARALMVADVHLGKAATFRSMGVPVPAGTTGATLSRLDALVLRWRPEQLFVLGDLLHGPAAHASGAVAALARWRAEHARIDVVLVRGNHDARAGDPPDDCGIRIVEEPSPLEGLHLCHQPRESEAGYVVAGHLHPAYRISGRVDSLRLPCFWVRERYAVLPAFGEFTGGWTVRAQPGDRVFVTDDERVHAVRCAA